MRTAYRLWSSRNDPLTASTKNSASAQDTSALPLRPEVPLSPTSSEASVRVFEEPPPPAYEETMLARLPRAEPVTNGQVSDEWVEMDEDVREGHTPAASILSIRADPRYSSL
jgi:hypothetical protein